MSTRDRFVSDTMSKMQKLPKSKRLECLQDQLKTLPEKERQTVEQGMMLALYSIDHSPAEETSFLSRMRESLHILDLIGVPLISVGVYLLTLQEADSEVKISIADQTVSGTGSGAILLLIGIAVCCVSRVLVSTEK